MDDPESVEYESDGSISMIQWCKQNGYGGVTQECITSAFSSSKPDVIKLAKREKLKGMIDGKSS